jgi:hypothetical protein
MMEAARTSETSVDNYFTRQYIPEDKSELYYSQPGLPGAEPRVTARTYCTVWLCPQL